MEKKENQINITNISLKLLILGDASVGKTSLITRYCTKEFQQVYITTIGIDKRRKNLNINNNQIKIIMWDTAGQERYRAINKSFYKGTDGVVLAFDLNKKKTIININYWIGQLYKESNVENLGIVLVGTKKDLFNINDSENVDKNEIEEACNKYTIKFFETSAKTGEGVKDMFEYLIKLTLSKKNFIELPFDGNLDNYKIIEYDKKEEDEINKKEMEKFMVAKKKKCC